MKKLLAIAAATLVAVFVVAPATVGATIVDLLTFQSAVDAAQAVDPTLAAPPNDGKHDFAVGGFRGVGGINNVGFSAHSDPNGANPYGHLSQTIPPQGRKDRFTVTCLAVTVNHAAIGLTAANATTAANFPNGRVLVVIDNGNPAGGQPVDNYGYVSSSTNNCTLYTATPVTNIPESGNILVHDEP